MPIWLTVIISHWSFKAISIGLVIILIVGGGFFLYKSIDGNAFQRGYSLALKEHPQNVYNAPTTVNQQPCPPPSVYGIDIGKWALGLVHKK